MKSIAGIQSDLMGAALAFKITYDDEYAAIYALHVLRHFKKVHKGDWSKMVQSYNAGNRYWNGRNYLKKVKANVKLIKQCVNKEI
jgi:soluble lytic murein transglycosylase-like protein